MTRTLALVVLLLALCGVAIDAQDMPPGKVALFAAQDKAKDAPLEEGIKYYEEVIAEFPGTVYAGQAMINIGSLYMKNKKWDEALENVEQVLAEYAGSYLIGQAIRRKFALLHYATGRSEEAVTYLEAAVAEYDGRFSARDSAWFPSYRYDAYKTLGEKEEALAVLEEATLLQPEVLEDWEFMRRYIPALQAAGERKEAQSVAKGAYAACKFTENDIKNVANLVVKAFASAGEVFKANQFLAAQEDAEKKNPLHDVPSLEITDEAMEILMEECRGNTHLKIVALLYYGAYNEAINLATERLGEAQNAETIAAAIDDVARCFKAKDLSLVRANQFLKYAKEGEGENPLLEF